MKIKKSKFAKLLTLALPIAAISIVTPVVLTSCGSSNSTTTPDKPDNGGTGDGGTSGGGSTGGDTGGSQTPSTVTASWNTSNFGSSITKDDNNNPVITLTDKVFDNTGLTKMSKFSAIKTSLNPTSVSTKTNSTSTTNEETTPAPTTTLFSLLSKAITNIDKFNVSLSLDPNTISFDFTNDSIANTVTGQFILTPKVETKESSSANQNQQKLSFTIQNFDDSYNGESGKQLTWNTKAIEDAFKKENQSSGNKLPEKTPSAGTDGKAAAAVINLNQEATLGTAMDELCGTTITGEELSNFINKGDQSQDLYNLSEAKISSWAPNVSNTMVFTRIVVPNKNGGENAILYIAYTGFKNPDENKIDAGNAAWNRNIPYFTNDISKDLWDLNYKEPVIDLSKIDGIDLGGGIKITKDSSVQDIQTNADKIRDYMAKNYILGFNDSFTISSSNETKVEGKFGEDGSFTANTQKSLLKSEVNVKSDGDDTTLKNNKNVFQIHFVVQAKEGKTITSSLYNTNNGANGIYKGFYLTGYKTTAKQN